MSDIEVLKERVVEEVDSRRDELIRMANTIHDHPEVAFEEHRSAGLLADLLESHGFVVERGQAGLDTAFVATFQGTAEGPAIAFLAEYDALPGLGHACGHNLIGTSAVGAGLAAQTVMPELGGTIHVIGTPGEEGGGGKAYLVDAGVFRGLDVAMMVHPSTRTQASRGTLTSYKVSIEFFGKPAHAAAEPSKGINALEALILTYNGINALRQHVRTDARIHGVITHGGEAPNIVPEYAAARFYVRAADKAYTSQVLEKVRACAEGAATATGASLKFEEYAPRYDTMLSNPVLADLFEANLQALGIELSPPEADERLGSSDMGNVSQVVPSLHPFIAIGPEEMGGHTQAFAEASRSPEGHEGMIQAAKLLAMTAVDLLGNPRTVEEARAAFREQTLGQG